jgi:hypothetical protein
VVQSECTSGKSKCCKSRWGHHYKVTSPGSSLSSRRAPRQTCHGRGANLRHHALQAAALPKELSKQLIRWLFGTSTWLPQCMWCHTWTYLEAISGSYVAFTRIACKWSNLMDIREVHVLRITLGSPGSSLSSRRQTCHGQGANL